ncbi:hypothetical protein [Nostoc commune]|uniref:hypothetical protein n=1 Tax=Nostoc commune TaxID=1178 RepID=UPI0020733C08|nr:hypothetical protein [Nostoc commune]
MIAPSSPIPLTHFTREAIALGGIRCRVRAIALFEVWVVRYAIALNKTYKISDRSKKE